MTWLHTYAKPVSGFPAVTFAATANITGQDRTPPGRAAVPFILAHDYIGGPATGWVHTEFLRKLLPGALREDLTTEAAIAISGAAFASAMGSQTRFYEVFLTIANARLGAWLPNPGFVALKRANLHDWTIPGFPARRRLSYFAREIFAIHPSTGRLLLCTDGGHYKISAWWNCCVAGEAHLLHRRQWRLATPRRRASRGDHARPRGTRRRDHPHQPGVRPGPRRRAAARTRQFLRQSEYSPPSKSQVAIGSITYPEVARRREQPGRAPRNGQEASSYPEAHGQLVLAQAVLTPTCGISYGFPPKRSRLPARTRRNRRSFFNAGQFDAYQTLGYFLGQKAALQPAAALGKYPVPQPPRQSRLRRQLRLIQLRRAQR